MGGRSGPTRWVHGAMTMKTAKVLVSDKLSEGGLDVLKRADCVDVDYKPGLSEDQLAEIIGDYDGLIIRSGSKVSEKVLNQAARLRVVGRAGIGVDNVDVPVASRRGVVVMNTPTGNAVTTAEHAISLLMSLARRIPQATASMRAGKWEKSKFQGREIAGKTLGVVGMGNIGRIVADRAQGLKMRVVAFDPVLSAERAASLGVTLVELDELFARADFITVHAPLTPQTKGLIGPDTFPKMKKGVMIINAARGGIVDEAGLAVALREGQVAGAALDVFSEEPVAKDHPLLELDNVVLTPHLGASTSEAQERVALEICEQVVDFLQTGTIRNAVNVTSLDGEAAEQLRPFQHLAHTLGRLLSQLESVHVSEVRVTCSGEASEHGVRPIANVALAGYLERFIETPVNSISAPYRAKERGISVVEVRADSFDRYRSSVSVTVTGKEGSHTAIGTLGSAGEALLVGFDDYVLNATLEGAMLAIYNEDKPGVIGGVGTVLGAAGINVSRMQVGLSSARALSLWNIEEEPDEQVVAKLTSLPHIDTVKPIKL